MSVDVSEVILDDELGEPFTILRSKGGQWVPGGYQQDEPQEIKAFGIVSMAQGENIESTPEGDRVTGAMTFRTVIPIHVTTTEGTSDIIVWRKQKYRVIDVDPFPNRGYWRATGVRMPGD